LDRRPPAGRSASVSLARRRDGGGPAGWKPALQRVRLKPDPFFYIWWKFVDKNGPWW